MVDRQQKNIYHIEDGNRDMITIIETVCADSSTFAPSVIFKGVQHDAQWGNPEDNPCQARYVTLKPLYFSDSKHSSVSLSLNGWTDQELGFLWIEKDFEWLTKDKANGKSRLLILDGHNSHCTYNFCEFAQKHNIVIVCLPPHTTHALQPCDVGVFGPLSQHWKWTVTMSTSQHVAITWQNFLLKYSDARQIAFTTATITAAWRKTGIYPLDWTALPESAFAPATSTTITSSQLIQAELPPILVPTPTTTPDITPSPSPFTTPTQTPVATPTQTPTPSAASAAALTVDNKPASPSPEPDTLIERYHIEMPLRLTAAASRQALVAQMINCEALLHRLVMCRRLCPENILLLTKLRTMVENKNKEG
jgi:hypothetical protein